MDRKKGIRVGVTMGDPSGIGPALMIKSLAVLGGKLDLTLIADRRILRKAGRISSCKKARIVDLENVAAKNFSFGKIDAAYARASIEYLDKAIELIEKDEIDCLVTCPISKEALRLAGINFPGHTEYLACKTGTRRFEMMLLNRKIRFISLTRHIRLKDVPGAITSQMLSDTGIFADRELKRLFSIKRPRMVVCGLNPHASDNGVIGDEENRVVKPAVRDLRQAGVDICGPFSADVAVQKAYSGDFDCAIAMYHDQALIPLKLLRGWPGANITLGLPFVRSSPLHGTAFDIASRPQIVDPSSLIYAVNLAVKCSQNLKRA